VILLRIRLAIFSISSKFLTVGTSAVLLSACSNDLRTSAVNCNIRHRSSRDRFASSGETGLAARGAHAGGRRSSRFGLNASRDEFTSSDGPFLRGQHRHQ